MIEKEFELCCKKIAKGDKEGLKDIYLAYMTYIYQVIYRVLGNKENAEDVTADFFIKLWDLAERYKPGNGHKTWLTTIARNMAIDYVRAHKKEVMLDEMPDVASDDEVVGGSGVSHGRVSSDLENEVVGDMAMKEALDLLRDNERQIINMKILGGLTFQEIADVLRIPLGTVTWRYQNALSKLRRCGYE